MRRESERVSKRTEQWTGDGTGQDKKSAVAIGKFPISILSAMIMFLLLVLLLPQRTIMLPLFQ